MVPVESEGQPRLVRIISQIVNQPGPVAVIDFKEDATTIDVDCLLLLEKDQGRALDDLSVMHINSGSGVEVEVMVLLVSPAIVRLKNARADAQMCPQNLVQVLLLIPGIFRGPDAVVFLSHSHHSRYSNFALFSN